MHVDDQPAFAPQRFGEITLEHVIPRLRLLLLIGAHLLISGMIAAVFVWRFDQAAAGIAGHVLLIAEWDVAIATTLLLAGSASLHHDARRHPAYTASTDPAFPRWPWVAFCSL